MEEKYLYHRFKSHFGENVYFFEEELKKFEKGKDFYFEDEFYIFSMNKKDNDLIKNYNGNISFYYKFYNKNEDFWLHSVIFSDNLFLYDVFLYSDSFLVANRANQIIKFVYDIKDIEKYKFRFVDSKRYYNYNFNESDVLSEMKILFKFFSKEKNIRLKILLNQNEFIKELLN